MKIALCDDQKIFLDYFSGQLKEYFTRRQRTCCLTLFTDAQSLLECREDFDVIFLDIKMDGMNGMELAQLLNEGGAKAQLVFLTAYRQYVFQAFDVNAAYYLVKPVTAQRLETVMEKLERQVRSRDKSSVIIQRGQKTERVFYQDLYFVEVMGRTLIYHTRQGLLECQGRMEETEKELSGRFFRCHRSYLVNTDLVRKFDRTGITMENGEWLPISKRKYESFELAFLHSVKKEGNW